MPDSYLEEFDKDPNEVLDYVFDWAPASNHRRGADGDWLVGGDTISTRTVTAESGLTVASSAITDDSTSVTVWLSGGTAGTSYRVSCRVVTAGGRTGERSMLIRVVDR